METQHYENVLAANSPKEKQPVGGNRNRSRVSLPQEKKCIEFQAPQVKKAKELLEWF